MLFYTFRPLIVAKKVEPLKVESVANILISADFLQIDDLVEECLAFIHRNVAEVKNAHV